ncbi:properdin-like [Rhopilema esculentum]|uniref:properdin-like n=1 Tax=Rhopilema esculentum TaxID=499914 RepID=UPI0031DC9BAF
MVRLTVFFAAVVLLFLQDVSCWRRRRRSPPPPPPRVNGGWSVWGPFSGCSKTCGGGVMHQYRHCNNPSPANGGSYCPGTNVNSESCNTHGCPPVVNGGWSNWGAPSSCSRTCGGGMRYRRRTCTNPSPANGGRPCDGGATISIRCNEHGCPDTPNSEIIVAPDGTMYQLVGCFDNRVHRLKEMLITERDHTSHAWNGEWIDWNNWDIYMKGFIHRCAMKTTSKNYRVFGMSYYGECWGDRTVSNAVEIFTSALKNPSKCVKEGYRDCSPGDLRCIGKHYGIAVYQIIEK